MGSDDPRTHVEVLRLGHRPERDKRITTHVAMVARAFGADSIHIDTKDINLERTINELKDRFGGDFSVETGVSRKSVMGKWKGAIVHLTMYGSSLDDAIREIPEGEDLLVVVGSEKVPADVYDLANFNISVGNQPHSEVSALAIFLDRFFKGEELKREMKGGQVRIIPSNTGKHMKGTGQDNTQSEGSDPFSMKWPSIPDKEKCLDLLSLLGASSSIIRHVKEVHRLGMDIVSLASREGRGNEVDIDIPLLEAGLILHDIGRTRTHSISHVTIGVELAERLGLDKRISEIIHNHPGAGLPREEAVGIGLPEEDHIPQTLEEKLVCHSDNLVGSGRRRPLSVPVRKLLDKGAPEAAERMRRLHLELERELEMDIDQLLPDEA